MRLTRPSSWECLSDRRPRIEKKIVLSFSILAPDAGWFFSTSPTIKRSTDGSFFLGRTKPGVGVGNGVVVGIVVVVGYSLKLWKSKNESIWVLRPKAKEKNVLNLICVATSWAKSCWRPQNVSHGDATSWGSSPCPFSHRPHRHRRRCRRHKNMDHLRLL